ncbi:MAG: hypothetical protein IPL06_18670 [Betaproteobacteria bacterium]|nr:hypothetical protein [Betaproteobacteria bacterium]
MRSALAALLCLAASPAAATYPVEIDAKTNGLAIEVKASAGTPLVVTFVSKEKANATCKASIATGLDTPVTKTVTVKGGKSTAVPFNLRSAPNRVRVIVVCTPPAVKSEAKT